MKIKCLLVPLLILVFQTDSIGADTTRVTITVHPDVLNTFKGIGYNITADLYMQGYQAIKNDPAKRHQFFEAFIKNANFQNIVLWGFRWWYNHETGAFDQDYMTYLKEAVEYGGIRHIIHNPNDKYHKLGLHTPFYEQLDFQTDIVKGLVGQGIDLYGMTYKNKPNTNESGTFRQREDSVALGIRLQRKMLDEAGLMNLKLSGPTTVEWHPRNPNENSGGDEYDYQDGDTERYLNALIDSTRAMSALSAIDKESYGDGMTEWFYNKAKQFDKDLWVVLSITENVGANDYDVNMPPVVAATLTSDINHGVTLWNTWLSYRLLVEKTLEPKPLYHYLKNVSTKFRYGAQIHRCSSDPAFPTTDMHWNYFNHEDPANYLQPKITSAACLNTDGRWSISLVNTSGIQAQHQIATVMPFDILDASVMDVEIEIPELRDTLSAWFSVYKSYPDQVARTGTLEMKNGILSLALKPGEHLVLESDSMSNIPGNTEAREFLAIQQIDVKAYPNPFSDRLTFEFNLPLEAEVEITIADLSGRIVAVPSSSHYSSGSHSVIWDVTENGSQLNEGIYLVKIAANGDSFESSKFVKVIMIN